MSEQPASSTATPRAGSMRAQQRSDSLFYFLPSSPPVRRQAKPLRLDVWCRDATGVFIINSPLSHSVGAIKSNFTFIFCLHLLNKYMSLLAEQIEPVCQ